MGLIKTCWDAMTDAWSIVLAEPTVAEQPVITTDFSE